MTNKSPAGLSPRQAAMFHKLASAKGEVVRSDDLAKASGLHPAHYTESRSLAMHVCRLRARVRDKGFEILSVRGTGYVLRDLNQASS